MDNSISLEPPKAEVKDYAYAILKGAIASVPIPIASGVASELLSLILVPPLTKRQEDWVSSIAQGLVKLREKVEGFKLEDLSENQVFITTVLHATQSALRNHQMEKLDALRNAVLNSALLNAPEEDLQLIFINWVDELTTWDLRILKFFDNPSKWAEENNKKFPTSWYMGGIDQVLEFAYPELTGKKELYLQFFNDLNSRGLAGLAIGMMTARGMVDSRTTTMGKQFLQFITYPKEMK
jgi:hypothetical protein